MPPPTQESGVPSKKIDASQTEEKIKIPAAAAENAKDAAVSGRERLKRHRVDVAGRVWIPDMWGQEGFLKDWSDCAAFDASLVNSSIVSARDSLVEEGRRASSARLRLESS